MAPSSRPESLNTASDPLSAPEFATLRDVRRSLSKGGLPATRTPADEARLSAFYVVQETLRFMEEFRARVRRGESVRIRAIEQKSVSGRLAIVLEIHSGAQEGNP